MSPSTSSSTSHLLARTSAPATPSQSLDAVVADAAAPPIAAPRPSIFDVGPSVQALLDRAAALGPMRGTLQSILLPNDPILRTKMEPRVAERRARFGRFVKATVGGCVALCAAALVATALSAGEAHASSAANPGRGPAAKAVTSVEKLDALTRGKAQKDGRDGRDVARLPRRASTSAPKHR